LTNLKSNVVYMKKIIFCN